MPTIKELDALNDEMTQWRRALHQKPEMAFEEKWTSDLSLIHISEPTRPY